VRGQGVEHRDDRVEHLLERADEAHPEVAVLVDGRQPAAQVRAAGRDRRRLLAAGRQLDQQRAEARSVERLVVAVPAAVAVRHD
jgi:hypothetical protein